MEEGNQQQQQQQTATTAEREREREAWMDHGGVQWMAENGKTQQGGFRPGNNPGVRRRAENGNNTVLD
jgi:hypothetical protein